MEQATIARICRDNNGDERTQTLIEHSNSVAVIARAIGERVGLAILAYLAGILHDAGKAAPGFQNYIRLSEEERREKKGRCAHLI